MVGITEIEALFHAALERPPEEREAFIRQQTNKPEVISELLALLKSAEEGTLSDPIKDAALEVYDSLDDNFVNTQLSHYKIQQRIGSGGMGAVYLAEHVDGSFDKKFAIKIVKKGMDSEQIVQRFKQERSILARLSHPNIAALVDGGLTDDGRPYFVMEYVRGEAINEYCDRKNLGLAARIALFRKVCAAVHYAHQNLVIHRDLKPSNVLVTHEGEVKLLDFGIAKLMDEDSDGAVSELTRTNMQLFTPAYAAPEQFLNAKSVSTSIDVYSLGVILYELLSGRRPYVASRTYEEYRKLVLEGELIKPSTVITREVLADDEKRQTSIKAICSARATGLKNLQRELQGDLDVICLMALRPEPEKRYQSVDQLAEDLQRHLNFEPIFARGDSFAYRLGRFYKKYRNAVWAGVSFLAILVATIVFYTQRITEERDLALQEKARTDEVVGFVTRLFSYADPMEGGSGDLSAREILDEGAAQLKAELANRPEIYAKLAAVLGEIYYQIGEKEKASTLLEEALQNQLAVYGNDAADSSATLRVIGFVNQDSDRFSDARVHFERSLAIAEKQFGERHTETVETLLALAKLDETEGQYTQAEKVYSRALELAQQLPVDVRTEYVAKAKSDFAELLRFQDRFPEAETHLREALALQRQELGEEHLHTLSTKRILAGLLREDSQLEESEALYLDVIAARTKILGEDHVEVVHTWNSYSQLLDKMGEYQKALDAITTVIERSERRYKGPHNSLAAMYHNRAYYNRSLGDYEAAITDFDLSIDMQDKVGMDVDHPHRAYPITSQAAVYMKMERWAEAQAGFEKAMAIRLKHFDIEHRLVLPLRSQLGFVLMKQGQFDAAEKHLLDILPVKLEKYGQEHSETQITLERLVFLYREMGRPDDEARYWDMLTEEYRTPLPKN